MGRDEVLQHAHSFLEVGQNRVLNDLCTFCTGLLGLGHQTTHTCQLANLVFRTTGTRVEHHVNGVETLVGLGHLLHQHITQFVVDMGPGINNLVVTLVVGDETHIVVVGNLTDFVITSCHQVNLLLRNNDVVEVERKTCKICHAVTKVLDTVEELAGTGKTYSLDHLGDDVAQAFLGYNLIDKSDFLRNYAIDDDTTYRGFHHLVNETALLIEIFDYHLDQSMEVALTFVVCNNGFFRTIEHESFTLCTGTNLCNIVETEHHVL